MPNLQVYRSFFLRCIYFESVSVLFCDVFIHLQSFLRRKLIYLQEVKMWTQGCILLVFYLKMVVRGLRRSGEEHKLEQNSAKWWVHVLILFYHHHHCFSLWHYLSELGAYLLARLHGLASFPSLPTVLCIQACLVFDTGCAGIDSGPSPCAFYTLPPERLSISITSNLSKENICQGENIGYNICVQKEKNRFNCWKRNIGKFIGQQSLWKAVTRNNDIIFAPWWCIMSCIFSKWAWQITHL